MWQKVNLFKNILHVCIFTTGLWNLNTSKVVFLHPAGWTDVDGAIHAFYLRPAALEYCITVCHASLLCIMQHVAD